MKKLLFLTAFFFAFLFSDATAQRVDYLHPVKYSKRDPVNAPKAWEGHVWYNTLTGVIWKYDRVGANWENESDWQRTPYYGEMSISNDTSTISFSNTTPAPIQDLTVGPANGFEIVSDSVLEYTGLVDGVFQINYTACISFAEAANIITGYVEVNGSQLPRRAFRQTITTLTTERETVNGTALVSLEPGDLIRFMFAHGSHTGTDVLTIYQFNLNLAELK